MAGVVNLNGCRVIIRDTAQAKTIVDSYIVDYDRTKNTISVNTWKLDEYNNHNVSVLAFSAHGLYEYMGTVRRGYNVGTGRWVEIGLFRGKELENRAFARYTLQLEGKVEGVKISGLNMPMDQVVGVTTENISANGMLIKGPTKRFALNHELHIKLKMDGKDAIFNCVVVRIKELNDGLSEFGCRILSVHM